MKKKIVTGLMVIGMCASLLMGCGEKKESGNVTAATEPATTETATKEEKHDTRVYGLINDLSIKEKGLKAITEEENGNEQIQAMLKEGVTIKAYINEAGELVIAEDVKDNLSAMNDISKIEEKNDGLAYVTFDGSKYEGNKDKTIKADINTKGELFVVMEDTVAAIELMEQ